MKKITLILSTMVALVVTAIIACNSDKKPSSNKEGIVEKQQPISQDSLISRGRYLVTVMVCNDCHSPKKMGPMGPEIDTARMLSGHPSGNPVAKADPKLTDSWILFNQDLTAFVGPWGTSFAANLTSDETGIGNWTEAQFFKAIREGKYKGMDNTRPLLPPMPWQMYTNASDEDLRAIFAYLKSTPPVENRVPAPVPPRQLAAK